jgi:uncharacterized SAM-binding protein YcdF (DUF218 family)
MKFWRRLIFSLFACWIGGFIWFWSQLPANDVLQGPDIKTDGIVVLTGGEGRVVRGLESLQAGRAKRLLISGVFINTRAADIAARTRMPLRLFKCCVDIDYDAGDTVGNAGEAAEWVTKNKYHSIRLVTSRYHVPRSLMEFQARLPETLFIIDAVPDTKSLLDLIREYDKLLVRLLRLRLSDPLLARLA